MVTVEIVLGPSDFNILHCDVGIKDHRLRFLHLNLDKMQRKMPT